MSDGGTVDFGEPIGEAETIHTIHSEMRTFGSSFGCREASFRLGLKPELLETLRELTKAPADEVAAQGEGGPAAVGLDSLGALGRGERRRARDAGPGSD